MVESGAASSDKDEHDSKHHEPVSHVHWRVAVLINDASGHKHLFGRTHEVSATVLTINFEQPLPVSKTVTIMLELPSVDTHIPATVIQLKTEIKSCVLSNDHYRIGLKIVAFEGDAKDKYLARVLSR